MIRVLYAIQGTGNGHLTRATHIVPVLEKKVNLDILMSGIQVDINAPFDLKYRYKGLSLIFGQKGGVDIINTIRKSDFRQLSRDIKKLPITDYDLVINDFEPVSAWAAKRNNVPCILLSHHAAVMNKHSPKPRKTDLIGKLIMKYYAPADQAFGFHFKSYDLNIFTPVIREQVRKQRVTNKGHYTVYLPAYGDDLIEKYLSCFNTVKWVVFSKHTDKLYQRGNVSIIPINNEEFIKSMASSAGVLCGAGFETPAEALYLGKKVMVIPMKFQYEQQCNAAAAKQLGVHVINDLSPKRFPKIDLWIKQENHITINYPDNTKDVIDQILETEH